MTSLYNSEHNKKQQFDEREELRSVNVSGDSLANRPDSYQLKTAVYALQIELDRAGRIDRPEVKEKFLQIEDFGKQVEDFAYKVQQQFKTLQQQLLAITSQMRLASDLDTLLGITVTEVREKINSDRAFIYRFNSPGKGVVLAESRTTGWTPSLGETIPATCFGLDQSEDYLAQQVVAIDDIYKAKLTPYQVQLLERFQVKASLSLPILVENKAWGLLVVQQCERVRYWQEAEISLLYQICTQLTLGLQRSQFCSQLQEQVEAEKTVTKVIERIRQSLDIDTIFNTTTKEVRLLLKADRVGVYRFNPDWSGAFVAESVATGWVPLVEKRDRSQRAQETLSNCTSMRSFIDSSHNGSYHSTQVADTYLQNTQGRGLLHRESFVAADIYNAGLSPCFIDILEKYEAKAYAIVPVFQGEKVWGLLAAYQNSGTRQWKESEVSFLAQIGAQLGVAVQQAETLEQVRVQSEKVAKAAERDRAVAKVIERIRQSLDIESIFKTTTKEVRSLLKADRVGVYRFNPDWSGNFIAESVGYGWVPFVENQANPKSLEADVSDCNALQNLVQSSGSTPPPAAPPLIKGGTGGGKLQVADTYLQDTQGGRFRNRECFAVADIYKAGFPPCYIEVLEQLEARAYATVPIFQGQKLWGLLATYQNSGSREWEDSEVTLLAQIASQLGVALQQAEYLQQLQAQSAQLAQAAQREKAAKELLQQRAIQLLAAVRPALDGDLTVRAPLTEDEMGTIADAYNNTLQALRKIVIQVQTAAEQVVQTSSTSDESLVGLTNLAQRQSQQIAQALEQMQHMVKSTQAVATNAELVEVAVQQANQTVEFGDTAMNQTVEAIQEIRETVSQTGKKIKRLSQSTQKISKVVNLISNFATQTNVLALNAAIEATRAGEYGKGFAVVADEVRSLSRQSTAATKEIEKLVQEIQAETGAVAAAMETGIQQVVEGTNLVSETRQSLNEIVAATAQISQLVLLITQATQVQTQQSVSVTQAMTDVAQIANQTSAESIQLAASFKQLLGMAQELLASAGKFKVN